MEQEYLVENSKNNLIIDFSNALKKAGILEGSDVYYDGENYNYPFFKIPKKYKKEEPTDPDVHYVFVDVVEEGLNGIEYVVCGNFTHEHCVDVESAVTLVKGLLTGEIVEFALVFPMHKAAFFMKNTGDPEQNVNSILEDDESVKFIMGEINSPLNQNFGMHLHKIFTKVYPYYIYVEPGKQDKIPDVQIYAVSSVFGEHPEYYVIK